MKRKRILGLSRVLNEFDVEVRIEVIEIQPQKLTPPPMAMEPLYEYSQAHWGALGAIFKCPLRQHSLRTRKIVVSTRSMRGGD